MMVFVFTLGAGWRPMAVVAALTAGLSVHNTLVGSSAPAMPKPTLPKAAPPKPAPTGAEPAKAKQDVSVAPPNTPMPASPQPGQTWITTHGLPEGFAWCWCPPGRATITDEQGRREVVFPEGFWLARTELTTRQALAIDRQFRVAAPGALSQKITPGDDPLTGVSRHQMAKFIERFNDAARQGGLPQPWVVALPSEAQWEYACRAGATTIYSFGDHPGDLPRYANTADKTLLESGEGYAYADSGLNDGAAQVADVGRYKPNAWGLHDMHGNVWEICDNGVARGGSWASLADNCRCDARHEQFAGQSSRHTRPWLGVRLAIVRPSAPTSKPAK